MFIDLDSFIEENVNSGAVIDVVGAVPIEKVNIAEQMLGVVFPASYKSFLEKYGAIEIDGRSFAGLTSNDVGVSGDVVAFTKYARENYNLPIRYVALDFQDGDAFLCIDTEQKDVHDESPIVLVNPINGLQLGRAAAVSFNDYLVQYLSS